MYLQIYVCIGLLITFEYCKLSGVECVFNILLECWALILRIWICKIVHDTTALFRIHTHRPLERCLTGVKNVTQRDMCFQVQNDPGNNVY